MPPTDAEQEKARAAMRRDARWARMILVQMWLAIGIAIFILTSPDPKPYTAIFGATGAVIVLTALWLLQPVLRWLMIRIHYVLLIAMDAADHLLQRYLQHQAIRRRGSLDSGPTSDGSSGSTSPRPDNGSGSE